MTKSRFSLRWLIRRDLPEICEIENSSFSDPWEMDDFIAAVRDRNIIGMTVEDGEFRVAGYIIYELHKFHLEILNVAVHPECRRDGVGRMVIERLADKLSLQRRTRLELSVRETNLTAQLFFRATGFLSDGIERNPYPDSDEDAYRMVFDIRQRELDVATLGRRNLFGE